MCDSHFALEEFLFCVRSHSHGGSHGQRREAADKTELKVLRVVVKVCARVRRRSEGVSTGFSQEGRELGGRWWNGQ